MTQELLSIMLWLQGEEYKSAFWRDPAWSTVGVIVTAVIGIVTIWLARRPRKDLAFKILSVTHLVTPHKETKDRVQILFDGKPIYGVELVLIQVVNAGNVPITSNDYESPIKLSLSPSNAKAHYLDAGVAEALPEGLLEKASVKFDEKTVVLEPVLLNGGDSITIKLLVAQFHGNISVEGRIVGIKTIRRIARGPRPLLLMLAGAFAFIPMIIASVFIGPSSPPFQQVVMYVFYFMGIIGLPIYFYGLWKDLISDDT